MLLYNLFSSASESFYKYASRVAVYYLLCEKY